MDNLAPIFRRILAIEQERIAELVSDLAAMKGKRGDEWKTARAILRNEIAMAKWSASGTEALAVAHERSL